MLVVASGQTNARGRSGSVWETAPRALAASLAFTLSWPTDSWGPIPLVAGVAAARVCPVDLKWPNDLVRADGNRVAVKLGGILIEAEGSMLIAGIGMNLWWPGAPDGIGGLWEDDPGPARAVELARSWAGGLLALVEQGPDGWPRDEYRDRCVTLGTGITWEPDGQGRAETVAVDGGLVVDTPNGRRTLRSGAVTHVRPDG